MERWRKVSEAINFEAEKIVLNIDHPRLIKSYYDICTDIDRHNMQHKYDLEL